MAHMELPYFAGNVSDVNFLPPLHPRCVAAAAISPRPSGGFFLGDVLGFDVLGAVYRKNRETLRIHGANSIFTYMKTININGIHVGKYTVRPMDPMKKRLQNP